VTTIPDWSTFLVAETGAAAALAGLLFVAISINLAKILEYPGVASRAAEGLVLLMGVVVIGTFGLAPNQSAKVLGSEILVVGILMWITTIRLQTSQLVHRKHPWWWLASRVAMAQCATVSFCITGISLIFGHPAGMYWLIPACVFSFVATTISAWVLLIEILR
jgi:hypothetical protein